MSRGLSGMWWNRNSWRRLAAEGIGFADGPAVSLGPATSYRISRRVSG